MTALHDAIDYSPVFTHLGVERERCGGPAALDGLPTLFVLPLRRRERARGLELRRELESVELLQEAHEEE